MNRFVDEEYHCYKDFEFLITDNDIEKLKQGKALYGDVDEEYTVILKYYEGGKMNKEDYQEVLERMEKATGNEVFCDVMCRFPYELNEEQLTEVCERCPLTESCEDSSQTITNLKKLKSFHNGSYGADIDKAIKALEFAEWVAEEIFSDDWEINKNVFFQIACRKLEKVGIVNLIDGYWVLTESEDKK